MKVRRQPDAPAGLHPYPLDRSVCVGPRAGLGKWGKRKVPAVKRNNDSSARSLVITLYWLSYPGSSAISYFAEEYRTSSLRQIIAKYNMRFSSWCMQDSIVMYANVVPFSFEK
jgi:hypothetical protein